MSYAQEKNENLQQEQGTKLLNEAKAGMEIYAKPLEGNLNSLVGNVDRVESDGSIVLGKKNDSSILPKRRTLPQGWIQRIDDNAIYLNKTEEQFNRFLGDSTLGSEPTRDQEKFGPKNGPLVQLNRSATGVIALCAFAMLAGCGEVKEKAVEVSNGFEIQGHWLMTESKNATVVEEALENESMVLTFKEGKAAFSPTDSVQGHTLHGLLSGCTSGPRPYRMDGNQIVFETVAGCPEKRVSVIELNQTKLIFPDPDNSEIVRTFRRIDEATRAARVRPEDRKL